MSPRTGFRGCGRTRWSTARRQELLRASEGLNLAVDFLPGSADFGPLGWTEDEGFASELLWFDALILNVDYSQVRYTGYNLLVVDCAPAPRGGTSKLLVRG